MGEGVKTETEMEMIVEGEVWWRSMGNPPDVELHMVESFELSTLRARS